MLRLAVLPLALSVALSTLAVAQEVSVRLSRDQIARNEPLEIVARVEGGRIRSCEGFPDLPAFQKQRVSSSTQAYITNGRQHVVDSRVQSYIPKKEGTFEVPPFTMRVNGQAVRFPGGTVKVGPPKQRQASHPRSIWEEFFGGDPRRRPSEEERYADVKADAFFAVTADREEVYVGEGFTVRVALYIAQTNKARLGFHELNSQLQQIVKDVRPDNCLEEDHNLTHVRDEYVRLNGKLYTRKTLFEATYYPISAEDVTLPRATLKLVKYASGRSNPFSVFNRKATGFEDFVSKAKTVKVKPLPPHPLRDQVNVGKYRLEEYVSPAPYRTGKSLTYRFSVLGEGNVAAIKEPTLAESEAFIFYSPNSAQNVNRVPEGVYGSKTYEYAVEPQEPGEYDLGDYVSWVYFDPEREVYDTLRAQASLVVEGESMRDRAIAANDLGDFYNKTDRRSNRLAYLGDRAALDLLANLGVLALLGAFAYLAVRRA